MRVQDLLAYQKSFRLAMEIFEVSKKFPREEEYSLTRSKLEDLLGVYPPILPNRMRNVGIPNILFPNSPIARVKIWKLKRG